jgi:hypothetical protein
LLHAAQAPGQGVAERVLGNEYMPSGQEVTAGGRQAGVCQGCVD